MRPIDEQTVLVTGATSGLGRHLVQRLAAAGATVVAHGRDLERLRRARDEICDATGREVHVILHCQGTSEDERIAAVARRYRSIVSFGWRKRKLRSRPESFRRCQSTPAPVARASYRHFC